MKRDFICLNPFCVIMGWIRKIKCPKQQPTEELIMAKLSELASALVAINDRLGKAKAEIVAKIDELQSALVADIVLPTDAQAALDALTASAQALDDIVPDPAPAPEPAPEPTPAP